MKSGSISVRGDAKEMPPIIRFDRPQSVSQLEVGHVVIAYENDEAGWWEAVVMQKDGDNLKLAWYGCPQQPEFTRTINQIALLCPAGAKSKQ